MTPDLTNLLLSLASAIAGPAQATVGTDLFIHTLPSSALGQTPAAVLRITGGPRPEMLRRLPAHSVQCMTMAADLADGLDLANRLYEALHETTGDLRGRPRSAWSIDAKTLDAGGALVADASIAGGQWTIGYLDIQQPPGQVGRDDAGRHEIAFNLDVHYAMPEAA